MTPTKVIVNANIWESVFPLEAQVKLYAISVQSIVVLEHYNDWFTLCSSDCHYSVLISARTVLKNTCSSVVTLSPFDVH